MNGTLTILSAYVWILVPLFPHAEHISSHPKYSPPPVVFPQGRREYARAASGESLTPVLAHPRFSTVGA